MLLSFRASPASVTNAASCHCHSHSHRFLINTFRDIDHGLRTSHLSSASSFSSAAVYLDDVDIAAARTDCQQPNSSGIVNRNAPLNDIKCDGMRPVFEAHVCISHLPLEAIRCFHYISGFTQPLICLSTISTYHSLLSRIVLLRDLHYEYFSIKRRLLSILDPGAGKEQSEASPLGRRFDASYAAVLPINKYCRNCNSCKDRSIQGSYTPI